MRKDDIRAVTMCCLIAFAFFTLIIPTPAVAQPAQTAPRVGYVFGGARAATMTSVGAFLDGLRDHGYIEGQNIVIEWRFAEDRHERLPELVADLVSRPVDVILAAAVQAARHAQKATTTIPIVFLAVSDPVAAGLVTSLARPSSNITGFTNVNVDLARKRLSVLHEAFPRVQKIGVLYSPSPQMARQMKELEAAAQSLRLTLHLIEATRPEHFTAAFAEFAKARVGAVFLPPQTLFYSHRRHLIDLATRNRIPLMGWVAHFVHDGAALSYGPDNLDMQRRAAGYVARILRGTKPSDLPVEQPARFELLINLRTIKALGLAVPATLLLQADHVIE